MSRKSRREIERMLDDLESDIDDIPSLGEIWFQSIQLGQGDIEASREADATSGSKNTLTHDGLTNKREIR